MARDERERIVERKIDWMDKEVEDFESERADALAILLAHRAMTHALRGFAPLGSSAREALAEQQRALDRKIKRTESRSLRDLEDRQNERLDRLEEHYEL